jgi:hypothetical protein
VVELTNCSFGRGRSAPRGRRPSRKVARALPTPIESPHPADPRNAVDVAHRIAEFPAPSCWRTRVLSFWRLSCHLSAPSPDSKSAQPQSNPPTPLIRGTPPMWRTELPNFRLLLAGVFPCRYSRPVIFWRLSCHLSAPSPDSKSAGLVPGPASAKSSDQFACPSLAYT